MGPFLWGKRPLKTPYKDFNLAIVGELGSMEWLKNGAREMFIFHALFLHYILFGEKFVG